MNLSLWAINIESVNPDCLRVDTSECWVVKLIPTCPPEVEAGSNVTVDTIYCEEWETCNVKKYIVNANCPDEKVKACKNDTTPWTLTEKLAAWHAITITPIGCEEETNSKLRIDVDENQFAEPDYPEVEVINNSNTVKLSVSWDKRHVITISDKEETTYDNMVCIGFTADQEFAVEINKAWNAEEPKFMWQNGKRWTIYTGNKKMATSEWIKILEDWYYRLFWQLTVQNNIDNDFYFNLWRWLLKINKWNSDDRTILDNMYLSTAKHWWYARQMLLDAWSGITITNQWVISTWSWGWQTWAGFDGPWMTYNIDCLVDLKKWNIITLWYRPQSSNKTNPNYHDMWDYSSNPIFGTFRFVWQNDESTSYNALFGGTLLGCYMLAPKLFQKWANNKIYDSI